MCMFLCVCVCACVYMNTEYKTNCGCSSWSCHQCFPPAKSVMACNLLPRLGWLPSQSQGAPWLYLPCLGSYTHATMLLNMGSGGSVPGLHAYEANTWCTEPSFQPHGSSLLAPLGQVREGRKVNNWGQPASGNVAGSAMSCAQCHPCRSRHVRLVD